MGCCVGWLHGPSSTVGGPSVRTANQSSRVVMLRRPLPCSLASTCATKSSSPGAGYHMLTQNAAAEHTCRPDGCSSDGTTCNVPAWKPTGNKALSLLPLWRTCNVPGVETVFCFSKVDGWRQAHCINKRRVPSSPSLYLDLLPRFRAWMLGMQCRLKRLKRIRVLAKPRI